MTFRNHEAHGYQLELGLLIILHNLCFMSYEKWVQKKMCLNNTCQP